MRHINYKKYVQREEVFNRAPYNPEISFYKYIQNGDLANVSKALEEPLHKKEGLGSLSDNRLQHFKYHFVITTAMVARKCIEGGLSFSTAYSLSDYYINMVDKLKRVEEISDLHIDMCIDYTKRMKNLSKQHIFSKQISRCVDYILDNLHLNITLTELARLVDLNESYLSRLFKKEMGVPISKYIQLKRVETAKEMLVSTDYPVSELASTLGFGGQSYFSKTFKDYVGVTPLEFRNKHFADNANEGA